LVPSDNEYHLHLLRFLRDQVISPPSLNGDYPADDHGFLEHYTISEHAYVFKCMVQSMILFGKGAVSMRGSAIRIPLSYSPRSHRALSAEQLSPHKSRFKLGDHQTTAAVPVPPKFPTKFPFRVRSSNVVELLCKSFVPEPYTRREPVILCRCTMAP
jgi:hypothetical protein